MNRWAVALSWLLLSTHACAADTFWRKARWQTSDGVLIDALYHPAAAQKGTWILLHGLGSTKGEWDGFARQAASALGDGFLVYDLRGHGDSRQTVDSEKVNYQDWTTVGPGTPWNKMPDDLAIAVKFLKDRNQVPASRIAVGGASLGANVALVYASHHSEVPALILLSPGMVYAGIASPDPFRGYKKRPLFMAASPQDVYAFDSVQQLAAQRGDSGLRLAQGPGAEHGVNMFKDPGFTAKLIDWMKGVQWK